MTETTLSTAVVITAMAVLAPFLSDLVRVVTIPVVVIEIALGILVGPQLLHLGDVDDFINALSQLGLSLLMFLAGFEADPARVKGRPLSLAVRGWLLSLVMALVVGAVLVLTGRALSALLVGLVLSTTAIGTLLPIVRDAGLLDSRFGTYLLAAGSVGEFGPIVAIALLLTTDNPLKTTLFLGAFVVVTLAAVALALRPRSERMERLLSHHLHTSVQLPVRVVVLLVFTMVWLASSLGLDVLLGSFAAGIIARLASAGADVEEVQSKIEGLGFGFLIPIFFVVTGMNFDLDALLSSPQAIVRLPVFLLLFLVIRGVPTLLYRQDLPREQLWPFALMCGTALPLVVVITSIGVATDRMTTTNASALVGAAMISVMLYPQLAVSRLRRHEARTPDVVPEP
jgi:Kef-type K+ transport system membrane component KefB